MADQQPHGTSSDRAEPTFDSAVQVLGSQVYRQAFDAMATGTEPAMLSEEQREAVRAARELTGTPAPGLPLPAGLDPTRPVFRDGSGTGTNGG